MFNTELNRIVQKISNSDIESELKQQFSSWNYTASLTSGQS